MYETDGDFGKVRLFRRMTSPRERELLFCGDAGWHQCNQLYRIRRNRGLGVPLIFMTVAGEGRLRLGERTYRLLPNQVGIAPVGVPIEYYATEGGLWEFYWLHPTGGQSQAMLETVADALGRVFPVPQIGSFTGQIEKLLALGQQREFALPASRLIYELLHGLLSLAGGAAAAVSQEPAHRILRFLEQEYARPITMKELSGRFYLSTAQINRVFRVETGCTPYEYLKRYRLLKASELLEYTRLSIQEIAARTGFGTVSNFIVQFRGEMGETPGQYRQSRNWQRPEK